MVSEVDEPLERAPLDAVVALVEEPEVEGGREFADGAVVSQFLRDSAAKRFRRWFHFSATRKPVHHETAQIRRNPPKSADEPPRAPSTRVAPKPRSPKTAEKAPVAPATGSAGRNRSEWVGTICIGLHVRAWRPSTSSWRTA